MNKKGLKILIFSWRDPKHPLAGGAEQVVHEHCKGWIKAGHKVTLFSSRMGKLKGHEILDKVEVIRSGNHYLGVQISGFIYYLRYREKYDLVVDQFHGWPFFTPLYVKKPLLALIQETARKVWFSNPLDFPLNWVVGVIGYLTEPFIFKLYKNTPFMTGSESAKYDVSKMGIPLKNITSIPHGVILLKKALRIKKQDQSTITYLGVLSKDKGVEDAIICFSLLRAEGRYKFWIIGKAETNVYENKLKNMVKKLNLEDVVKFWGFVPQGDKFNLLAKSYLLINPSSHEGWGLVNIEANSVATPVVSYNNAGLIDSVSDGVSGIICSENNPESLASNVIRIFNDKKLYQKLQKGAIGWSKIFKWEKSVKLSLELINKVSRQT